MTLPPVAPAVLADVLDALPPRLRKRVDTSLDRASGWAITTSPTEARAELDPETTLTWTLHDGVLTDATNLACTCLLAPKCLHRGVAVAAAPITDPATTPPAPDPPPPGESAAPHTDPATAPGGSPPPARVDGEVPTAVSPAEQDAANALWAACATILRAGATGSGVVVRAELLRAVHTARVTGLHRAAAGGLHIATALAACQSGDSSFDREVLAAELVDLMLLCHDLRTTPTATTAHRGTARREYRPIGSLRLYGLCTEAVVTTTGYGGVVTHLVDDTGTLWTVPSILPGGPERVPAAANGPVAIGESGLTHHALGRAGLLLSGGTASPDHRLGAGKQVRAVAASGAPWDTEPLTALWSRPLTDQLTAAFAALDLPESHRPPTLLFAEGEVAAPAGHALRMSTATGTLDLTTDDDTTRENLRVLAKFPGLPLRVIARPTLDHPGTATPLAVASPALTLPKPLNTHADLSLDHLQPSYITHPSTPTQHLTPTPTSLPTPLAPLKNVLHRITLGGRPAAAPPSTARAATTLATTGLTTTAALLTDLATTCRDRDRDAFGRVVRDDTEAFPTAWLRAGLHVREFTRAVARQAWLEAVG
ncbi:hypothetical protein AB0A74_33480 [Saccharothrix sp. NPDC042600]|uniref:hypothetical protein n=1 Tax=Saccharothrix TaxID=2071 RepID=UPI0033C983F5|nr:hypothetical protein GCM10017745_62590 [Saccharothrix mutabilis subsp. capreolus]